MLDVERRHGYRTEYQSVLEALRQGKDIPMPNISYETNPSRSVYYANLSRIGMLGSPAAEKLVALAYQWEVIATDRMSMDRGTWDKKPLAQREAFLQHHLETYDLALERLEELAPLLSTS